MKELLKIKEFLENDKDGEYILETTNKKTGWIGCASFHTNGEKKIHVNEGDSSGSDDDSYSYADFLKKYDYVLKKESDTIKPKNHFNMFTLIGRINDFYFNEKKKKHVIVISSSNPFGDFTVPFNAYGKLNNDVLKILKKNTIIGIKGFVGADDEGHIELNVEKFVILARREDQ